MTEPTVAAIAGSVRKVLPPITPARPASAAPAPNTSMNTRGTLWPSASTISGCVSAAWITRPMRVRVSSSHTDTSISTATSIMKPRVAGKRRAHHAHGIGRAAQFGARRAPDQAQARRPNG
jgi:hypothetical protein